MDLISGWVQSTHWVWYVETIGHRVNNQTPLMRKT